MAVIAEHESLGGTCILVDNIASGSHLWAALEALHTRVMIDLGGDGLQADYLRVLDEAKSRLEEPGAEPNEGRD